MNWGAICQSLNTSFARYCLSDSFFLFGCNPETLSRVTLATLGIGFQPKPVEEVSTKCFSSFFLSVGTLLIIYLLEKTKCQFVRLFVEISKKSSHSMKFAY